MTPPPPASRALTAATGLAALCLYLAGVVVSGRLSPLARQPLLDGQVPPSPYRYVKPPPALATSNRKPDTARLTINPGAGGGAGVYQTNDQQAAIVFENDTIPAAVGGRLTITIEPLDPAPVASPPDGMTLVGNAYRLALKTKDGKAIEKLAAPAPIVLRYPSESGSFTRRHTVLILEGTSWRALESIEARGAQQVNADVGHLGTFVVGRSIRPDMVHAGRRSPVPIIASVAGGIAAIAAGVAYRVGRGRKRRRKKPPPRGARKPRR
jgi:hypothetical protein